MNRPHEVELSVEQTVKILAAVGDPNRTDLDILYLRTGFVHGLKGEESRAKPGQDPEIYGSGYQFGAQLRELIFWTHELQADADRLP